MVNLLLIIIVDTTVILFLIHIFKKVHIKKLAIYTSPYVKRIVVKQLPTGEKQLEMNYCVQGIDYKAKRIKETYWYTAAQIALTHCQSIPSPAILHVGLGANTSTNIINKANPKITQTVIEIDPVITKICRKYFDLDTTTNIEIIEKDFFEILQNPPPNFINSFDVIFTDIYTGTSAIKHIEEKYSMVQKIIPWLKPNSLLIFNRPAHTQELKQDATDLENYLKRYFSKVEKQYIDDYHHFENYIITASNLK